jgi:NDP-sugar pyrophosphorylase family protein
MPNQKGFLLSAGFGTRFKPQSLFLPKPALPFLNVPQALFPAAALKSAGVDDFFYNSHHLPDELDSALKPYFNRNSLFEKEILDSAGGISNAEEELKDQENFWVANGDSLVFLNDQDVLNEAFDFHVKENASATLIGVTKPFKDLSGLESDSSSTFTGISRSSEALHFIGFYIFNRSIFENLKKEKQHIFHDVLLNKFSGKTLVYDAKERITWYETGNETDFLNAASIRLKDLKLKQQKSQTYKALAQWHLNSKDTLDNNLENFLNHKIWGEAQDSKYSIDDFLCIGENTAGDFSKLNNSILGPNLRFDSQQFFNNQVLIDSSQWT